MAQALSSESPPSPALLRARVLISRIAGAYRARPALFQLTATTLYLAVGISFLEFSVTWLDVAAALLAAALAEAFFSYRLKGKASVTASTFSAVVSLGLFFRATDPSYFALAGLLAIASKYLLRLPGRHIFNPSNLSLVILPFVFPAAVTVEFTQWGHNFFLYAAIAAISLSAAYATRTIDISLPFLASYAVLLVPAVAYDPALFSVHHYGLLGPSLIVFACHMITDPRTAPRGRRARIFYGMAIALAYFLLELFSVRYAILVSLFLILLFIALVETAARLAKRPLPGSSAGWALLVAAVLVAGAFGLRFNDRGFSLDPLRLSPEFLAFGIESNTFLDCASDPALEPRSASGLEHAGLVVGAAWGDYDGDGYDDLFVSYKDQPSRLYRNNRDGTFTDVTARSGLPLRPSSSAYWADYDNDGKLDLFVTFPFDPAEPPSSASALAVYHNDGSTFTDVTRRLGLSDFKLPLGDAGMSFADFNNDGRLDFVFASDGENAFVDYANPAFEKSFSDPEFYQNLEFTCDPARMQEILSHRPAPQNTAAERNLAAFEAHPEPKCLAAVHSLPPVPHAPSSGDILAATLLIPGSLHLFENRGGSFVEHSDFARMVAREIGTPEATLDEGVHPFEALSGRFYQPISFDYNGDGKPDIFVTTDFGRSLLLADEGNFSFKDVTAQEGLDYEGSNMGVDIADLHHSGAFELFTTNVFRDFLYERNRNAFAMASDTIARLGVGWGASFLDYDLDGWEDLFITNGDIPRNSLAPIPALSRSLYRMDNLYRNDHGSLKDRTGEDMCPSTQSGKVLAVSDYDNDGDPDVFIGNLVGMGLSGSGNILYENKTNAPGRAAREYLELELRGTKSNRMGIGSIVSVTGAAGTQTQVELVGNSYHSENSPTLLFGLGTSTAPVEVVVHWPSGRTSTLRASPDERLTVTEP